MSERSTLIPPAAETRGGKYMTFALGAEEFGLAILKVREIFGYMPITAVPMTPDYVKGVINLRGQVISVIDLRQRFGMPQAPTTNKTCIIVVDAASDGRRVCIGIVVDHVSEVLTIPASNIEDAPDFGADVNTSFILGMGKVGSSVKALLDIEKVLTSKDSVRRSAVKS